MTVFLIYLATVSVISISVTCYDKIAAKKRPGNRIREKTLFLFACLGGSLPMLVTMGVIRHKTRHLRFMLGLPLIFTAQTALFIFAYFYLIPLIKNHN